MLKIRVLTIDTATGQGESMRTIDYTVSDQREWLTRHMGYALNNGKSVETWEVGTDYDTDRCDGITEKWGHLPRHKIVEQD